MLRRLKIPEKNKNSRKKTNCWCTDLYEMEAFLYPREVCKRWYNDDVCKRNISKERYITDIVLCWLGGFVLCFFFSGTCYLMMFGELFDKDTKYGSAQLTFVSNHYDR